MKARFRIELLGNPKLMGVLHIDVSVPKETQAVALALGIGEEEQKNLVGQRLQEVIQLIGLDSDDEL
jgi:hypothetical protein